MIATKRKRERHSDRETEKKRETEIIARQIDRENRTQQRQCKIHKQIQKKKKKNFSQMTERERYQYRLENGHKREMLNSFGMDPSHVWPWIP